MSFIVALYCLNIDSSSYTVLKFVDVRFKRLWFSLLIVQNYPFPDMKVRVATDFSGRIVGNRLRKIVKKVFYLLVDMEYLFSCST